ncbi:GNAT family N-acetyltransferase [Micromonospora sp. NBC_01813]|uniref:GNAT family N-acetyltransferase n=1 Tax=Micromonospora sp. NBC_01813 TaxID=2975988 RepID=UPI002DDABBE4|nr:GNAT family N-acetyltransferase [Micromonospora sp. NBC_01813]WSA08890.1 GNAT family N-acetyltransferase [Micromonospora sp. NBC_01813]
MLDKRLYHHLVSWLGQWPAGRALQVVGSERRVRPGWDGRPHPVVGVGAPGGAVLSVPPDKVGAVRSLTDLPVNDLLAKLPAAVGYAGWRAHRAVFRYCLAPTPLPDVGDWIDPTDDVVPPWLQRFTSPVLVARDADGAFLAGVGLKRHDAHGQEISVGTVAAARGRGLASRLVAQAARQVLDAGAVPTYLHEATNTASAKVAAAAGFRDRGWTAYGISEN